MRRALLALLALFVILAGVPPVPPVAEATYNPSAIKSVQYGSITLADGGGTTGTATITAVVVANSTVLYLGHLENNVVNVNTAHAAYVVLTNTTTITATRSQTSGTTIVRFVVLEFRSGTVKSRQSDAITVGASTTATITSVITAKSVIFPNGYTYSDTTTAGAASYYVPVTLTLTNATTVTAARGATNGTLIVQFTVLEFK